MQFDVHIHDFAGVVQQRAQEHAIHPHDFTVYHVFGWGVWRQNGVATQAHGVNRHVQTVQQQATLAGVMVVL